MGVVLVCENLDEAPAGSLPNLLVTFLDIFHQTWHKSVLKLWHVEFTDLLG